MVLYCLGGGTDDSFKKLLTKVTTKLKLFTPK